MDVDELKRLIVLMNENELVELEYEEDGRKVRLRKAGDRELVQVPSLALGHALDPSMVRNTGAAGAPPPEGKEDRREADLVEIKSPLVGTFYRSPRSDADAFVDAGDAVTEERVVCIIEAMKVMNEIKAEVSGTIREILVQNGEPVEFGQALFLVKLA